MKLRIAFLVFLLGFSLNAFAGFEEARVVLQNKCAACHSEAGKKPASSKVFIVNHMMGTHVKMAREHFDLDAFLAQGENAPKEVLGDLIHVFEDGEMPPAMYRFFHRSSKVSKEEAQTVLEWLKLQAAG